jgi:hypothetical protein
VEVKMIYYNLGGGHTLRIVVGITMLIALMRRGICARTARRGGWMREGVLRAYRRRREHDQLYKTKGN